MAASGFLRAWQVPSGVPGYSLGQGGTSLQIDHVAIVVADLPSALELYTRTLGFTQLYRETLEDQGVEAVGLRAGESTIELLRPLDETSAIARYRGDVPMKLHHTAYRVSNLETELARLKRAGVRLIDEHPRRGAQGNAIAFLHPKSTGGVLIELVEKALRPGLGTARALRYANATQDDN